MNENAQPGVLTAEHILGINSRIIQKTKALPSPHAKIVTIEPDLSTLKAVPTVEVAWGKAESFQGGVVAMHYAHDIDLDGRAKGDGVDILASYLEVDYDPAKGPSYRNPAESMSAFLSMIATINRAANIGNEQIVHVARANKYTLSYFERMRDAGLYSYADSQGTSTENPVMIRANTLFVSTYPNQALEKLLGRFVVADGAKKLVELRNLLVIK